MSDLHMKDDIPTLAALAILATCVVTIAHEVAGHGAACLIVGGEIVNISSSLFACSRLDALVPVAGPAANVALGLGAMFFHIALPERRTAWRLFLLDVAALSLFWEAGYLVKAMLLADGDLYFFASSLLGGDDRYWRPAMLAVGCGIYLAVLATISARLGAMLPTDRARRAARVTWLAATLTSATAALFFTGPFLPNFRDAILETGAAALPLLLIPRRASADAAPPLPRSAAILALGLIVFAGFSATVGRGLGTF